MGMGIGETALILVVFLLVVGAIAWLAIRGVRRAIASRRPPIGAEARLRRQKE